MRRPLLAIVAALVLSAIIVGPAGAAYESFSGGEATPSVLAADGGTDYSVSISGKAAAVDLVLVLDNSSSMNDPFGGGGSKWNTLASVSKNFVDELNADGFFARGGKVGVEPFSTAATTGTAPTADISAIKQAIDESAPSGDGCIACGLQQATALLAGVPGSSTHKRIAYIVADGPNTGTSPTVPEAVAGAQAAGVERRVIGLGSGASTAGLEAFASDGTVLYPTNAAELTSAFAAKPTRLPGATNLSWSFHLAPGFTATAPSASVGSAVAGGSDVTWTIPSLGEGTATLSFHATHDPAAGCAASALLSGTTFSDAEGDAAPAVALGPLSVGGCAQPGGGSGSGGGAGGGGTGSNGAGSGAGSPAPSKLTPSSVIALPATSSKCSKRRQIRVGIKPPKGTQIEKASVKVGGGKAKVYRGARARSGIVITELPVGHYKVVVTVTLSDGRSVTLSRKYFGCPAP